MHIFLSSSYYTIKTGENPPAYERKFQISPSVYSDIFVDLQFSLENATILLSCIITQAVYFDRRNQKKGMK
jgi:hypothetical protein